MVSDAYYKTLNHTISKSWVTYPRTFPTIDHTALVLAYPILLLSHVAGSGKWSTNHSCSTGGYFCKRVFVKTWSLLGCEQASSKSTRDSWNYACTQVVSSTLLFTEEKAEYIFLTSRTFTVIPLFLYCLKRISRNGRTLFTHSMRPHSSFRGVTWYVRISVSMY